MTEGTGGDTAGREIEPWTGQRWAPRGSIGPDPAPDPPADPAPDPPADPLPDPPARPADAGRTSADVPIWGTAPPEGTPMWTAPPAGTPVRRRPLSRPALPPPPPWGTPPPVRDGPPPSPETEDLPPAGTPSLTGQPARPTGGPERPISAVAVAALVVGLVGIVFPGLGLVGIGLAAVALVQLRSGRERGQGIAVAGLVVSLLWPVLFLAATVAAFSQLTPRSR